MENLIKIVASIQKRIGDLAISDPTSIIEFEAHTGDQERRIRAIVTNEAEAVSQEDAERICAEYFGNGPLTSLISDESITEILINDATSIWFEKDGRLQAHHDRFLSQLTFKNFIQRLSREAQVQTSLDCPFADGYWSDFRIHLAIPPMTPQISLSLRRHPKIPWRLKTLASKGWASASAIELIRDLVVQKKNLLVVGCTGSGKTSVLNACLQEMKSDERAVIIEDTSELKAPNSVSNRLLTRRDSHGILRDVDQSELLKQCLRMRPDRIVMGEIRSHEAKDLLMAFATGHSGCMGTLHAESARQALIRLEMLIQLGAAQWGLQAVRTLILLSLHAIIVVKKTPEGERKLEGVYRIASLEDVGFLLEKVC